METKVISKGRKRISKYLLIEQFYHQESKGSAYRLITDTTMGLEVHCLSLV